MSTLICRFGCIKAVIVILGCPDLQLQVGCEKIRANVASRKVSAGIYKEEGSFVGMT